MARKFQNLAAPDDPNTYYAVDGLWATARGTYETCTLLTAGTTRTDNTSGGNGGFAAFIARTLAGTREYLVVPLAMYEYSGGSYTDRTGGVTVGASPMLAEFGDVTLCVMGAGTVTVKSTGGNFSALAGAPQGEIVVVCAGAVLVFNTNTSADGWAASDVFDYTNWATGESASGRLLDTNGPVLAACTFGGAVYAYKSNSIYRGEYVGGVVKWSWRCIVHNIGVSPTGASGSSARSVCAGTNEMMFMGAADATHFATGAGKSAPSPRSYYAYLFDGSSAPRISNALTSITAGSTFLPTAPPGILHDPQSNMYTVTTQNVGYFYNVIADAWGYKSSLMAGLDSQGGFRTLPIYGDFTARSAVTPMPEFYGVTLRVLVGGLPFTLTRFALDTTLANIGAHFVQTSMAGKIDAKTAFNQVIPRLRRRNGSGTAALSAAFYRELENTTAEHTLPIVESTFRHRFDVSGVGSTDNFGRFKVTFSALDVEVDDIIVKGTPAGAN